MKKIFYLLVVLVAMFSFAPEVNADVFDDNTYVTGNYFKVGDKVSFHKNFTNCFDDATIEYDSTYLKLDSVNFYYKYSGSRGSSFDYTYKDENGKITITKLKSESECLINDKMWLEAIVTFDTLTSGSTLISLSVNDEFARLDDPIKLVHDIVIESQDCPTQISEETPSNNAKCPSCPTCTKCEKFDDTISRNNNILLYMSLGFNLLIIVMVAALLFKSRNAVKKQSN